MGWITYLTFVYFIVGGPWVLLDHSCGDADVSFQLHHGWGDKGENIIHAHLPIHLNGSTVIPVIAISLGVRPSPLTS